MSSTFSKVIVAGAVVMAVGAAFATLRAQDRTDRPGFPTKPSVWVENRGAAEAIPITIESMQSTATPLRVEVTSTASTAAFVRQVRQQWEYQAILIPTGQDPTAALNEAGTQSWEVIGLSVTAQGGTRVVLKRPR